MGSSPPVCGPVGFADVAADDGIRSLTGGDAIGWWSELDRGGHLPALEAPDLLVAAVQAFFRQHR